METNFERSNKESIEEMMRIARNIRGPIYSYLEVDENASKLANNLINTIEDLKQLDFQSYLLGGRSFLVAIHKISLSLEDIFLRSKEMEKERGININTKKCLDEVLILKHLSKDMINDMPKNQSEKTFMINITKKGA